MSRQHRILVLGGSCSGKTTLARQLSQKLQIKVFHLDDYYWFGEWQNIGKERLLEEVHEITVREEEWIIEGNYSIVRDNIWQDCTCIYLCYTAPLTLFFRILRRSFDRERKGVPLEVRRSTKLREPFFELLYHAMRYQLVKRKRDLDFCYTAEKQGKDVRIINCTRQNISTEIGRY